MTRIEPDHILQFQDYVKTKLKRLRKTHRLSQQKIAKTLGISFQQYQKYENGKNRISASRYLYLLEYYEKRAHKAPLKKGINLKTMSSDDH